MTKYPNKNGLFSIFSQKWKTREILAKFPFLKIVLKAGVAFDSLILYAKALYVYM